MSEREQILQQALALPPEDRAYVAVALESSLGNIDPPDVQSANRLLTELQRRSAAYRANQTTARASTEVLADLSRRQAHVNHVIWPNSQIARAAAGPRRLFTPPRTFVRYDGLA